MFKGLEVRDFYLLLYYQYPGCIDLRVNIECIDVLFFLFYFVTLHAYDL